MRWLAGVAVLIVLAVVSARVDAAPPMLSEKGCGIVADMVLVARSLAAEGIERDKAEKIMAQVYVAYEGREVAELRQALTNFAYRVKEAPLDLAKMVARACLSSGGSLAPILGTGV